MGIRGIRRISKCNYKKETIIVILAASAILVGGNLFEQSLEHPYPPEIMYASDGGRHLITINTNTGAGTTIAPMSPVPAGRGYVGLTFDPSSPELLWAGQGSGSSNIYNINIVSGATTLVGPAGLGSTAVNAMDAGPPTGEPPICELFAVLDRMSSTDSNNRLVKISKSNGAAANVGTLGLKGMDSIAFKSDGTLYGVANTFSSKSPTVTKLYTINLSTGVPVLTPIAQVKDSITNKNPSGGILSIEFGQDDTLYAGTGKGVSSAKDSGVVGTINLSTGIFKRVGTVAATTGSPLEAFAFLMGDNFPPKVKLVGDNLITIQKGKTFLDPGATSFDCHEGPQTVLDGVPPPDMNTVDDYTLSYTKSDPTGKIGSAIRIVNVIDFIDHGPYTINEEAIDEDPVDGVDNDGDGLTDEDIGDVNDVNDIGINNDNDYTRFASTFEIQDALVPTGINTIRARIFTDPSDLTGINVDFTRVGSTISFLNTDVFLINGLSVVDNQNKLKAGTGDDIRIFYNTVTSDPFVAGTSPNGIGNSPPSTDKIRLDSTDFVVETSTSIYVTLTGCNPLAPTVATCPDAVTATIFETPTGNSLTLTTLTRQGSTNTYKTVLPVYLSAGTGSVVQGSSTVNPILTGLQAGDIIFVTSPSVTGFTARATIIATPPSIRYDTPVVPVVYGTGVLCSTLGLSDPDNDGICSGDSSLIPWETGTTALRIYTATSERSGGAGSAAIYNYRSTETGVPASGCPRLLNVPSSPVVRADNPFTCPHPSKKDIYVEIDYYVNHRPDVNALMDVINAFKNRGVNLHILLDEQMWQCSVQNDPTCTNTGSVRIPLHESTTTWARYLILKGEFFGSESEQGLTDALAKLTKKAQVFHYNAWIHATTEVPDSSGRSEIGGNDFEVSLGRFFNNVGTQDLQAAVFMHELSHNLNLDHGGASTDPVNCKPNYPSIMNYAQFLPFESGGFLPKAGNHWRLDLSGVQLTNIDENALSESVNAMVGADAKRSPIYTVIGGPGLPPLEVQTGGLINWNRVAGPSGTYAQNVRDMGINGCRPLDANQFLPGPDITLVLAGYNDWANIKPNIRSLGGFALGLSTVPHQDGDTFRPVTDDTAPSSAPYVALPSSNFAIDEGDGNTDIPLARIIDYDSIGTDAVNALIDWDLDDVIESVPTETITDVTSVGTLLTNVLYPLPADPDVDLSGTHAYGDNGFPTIQLTVTNNRQGQTVVTLVDDNQVPLITVRNVAPSIVGAPTVSPSTTIAPGEQVTVSVQFTDPGRLDTHTGSTINWGEGTPSANVVESNGQGSVSDSHSYSTSGTKTVTITVLDDDGGFTSTDVTITVVAPQLGNFISPIDNSQYNSKRTLPVKIPVTLNNEPYDSATLKVYLCDTVPLNTGPETSPLVSANCIPDTGNIMVWNDVGNFYDYSLKFPPNTSGWKIIKVELAGSDPLQFKESRIQVS